MILQSGEFRAFVDDDGDFAISITQESELSIDGGYTFEDAVNTFYIDRENAKHLINELQSYINTDT